MRPIMLALTLTLFAGAAFANPDAWAREWPDTDFQTTTIDDWSEIISGGPPRDGIPALSDPEFRPASEEDRIDGREPVITVEIAGATPRAYPIRYLTWHEIVNDVVGGVPIAVTFCPLCNSGITFDRRVEGRVLDFGVSGKLRHSDMIMYDRQTESWWQQAIGAAVVGELTGTELERLPTWMESWDAFTARNPEGLVMQEPAHPRDYGRNPYVKYDSAQRPFLYRGENPPHDIPPLARVVAIDDQAWPLTRLAKEGRIAEAGYVLSWSAGQASALDTARIADARDVGTVRVRDAQGNDVAHDVMFAFAFHAFWPEGDWMLAE
ncbi:MAG: DUF3179 domain-containing protein [Salibaculum sp.]|uniref:DUF3179 domain-containing protein n=1 Tax=Salibaculum sp. TaxID=2855480 RepID=UPI0028706616|nr:DUF3179 domain-containing protein [Salibaculum sp.]MDR9427537.1 DUF3179 domain-containing protein [Salibaculum sp.]